MKNTVKLGLGFLACVVLLTGCGENKTTNNNNTENNNSNNQQQEEQIKVNTNEDVVKDQTLENFKFENTSLIYENGNSRLETIVTNTGSETEYLTEFKIHVRDEEGQEIVQLIGFIGDSLGAGESRTITTTYGDDLSKAASIDYEVKR